MIIFLKETEYRMANMKNSQKSTKFKICLEINVSLCLVSAESSKSWLLNIMFSFLF